MEMGQKDMTKTMDVSMKRFPAQRKKTENTNYDLVYYIHCKFYETAFLFWRGVHVCVYMLLFSFVFMRQDLAS